MRDLNRLLARLTEQEAPTVERVEKDPHYWLGWCGKALDLAVAGMQRSREKLAEAVERENWTAAHSALRALDTTLDAAQSAVRSMEKQQAPAQEAER